MAINDYDVNFIEYNPWQTRQNEPDPEYIKDLAQDIQRNGLLQIPIGRNVDGKVQLAFGHNRLRAYLYLKMPIMPVDVRELNDEQMAIMAWSENEKRRDHTAIERAWAIEKRIKDFGWTNRQAADALGVDHSTISNMLRLLKLPEDLQEANIEGKVSERQLQAILPLYEMPQSVSHLTSNYYYFSSPSQIMREALEGYSSDHLRKEVERFFAGASQDLSKAEFKLNQLFTEGTRIYCGLCSTCDERMPSRNLCFNKTCFEAKTDIVRRLYLANASIKIGYDMIDFDKGGNVTELSDDDIERIKEIKCPNLRLTYTAVELKEVRGFPHARFVCDKRNNSCTCIKGFRILSKQEFQSKFQKPKESLGTGEEMIEIGKDEELSSDEDEVIKIQQEPALDNLALEETVRQERQKKNELINMQGEIEEKLKQHFKKMFNRLEPGAFYYILYKNHYCQAEDLTLDEIFNSFAYEASNYLINQVNFAESVDRMIEYINNAMEDLHLDPFSPEDYNQAETVKIEKEKNIVPL